MKGLEQTDEGCTPILNVGHVLHTQTILMIIKVFMTKLHEKTYAKIISKIICSYWHENLFYFLKAKKKNSIFGFTTNSGQPENLGTSSKIKKHQVRTFLYQIELY